MAPILVRCSRSTSTRSDVRRPSSFCISGTTLRSRCQPSRLTTRVICLAMAATSPSASPILRSLCLHPQLAPYIDLRVGDERRRKTSLLDCSPGSHEVFQGQPALSEPAACMMKVKVMRLVPPPMPRLARGLAHVLGIETRCAPR